MSPSSSPERRASRISIVTAAASAPDRDQPNLQLPARVDFDAARELHGALRDRCGLPLEVDGTAVAFCGALAAQVLVAASRETAAAGHSFVLRASTALRDDLSRLGVLGEFPNLVEVAEC
jgi:anti-anti-sigma regulatory factor